MVHGTANEKHVDKYHSIKVLPHYGTQHTSHHLNLSHQSHSHRLWHLLVAAKNHTQNSIMHIIIHSKYFSVSDWVKYITSYYVLLTKFGQILQYVKNDVNCAA